MFYDARNWKIWAWIASCVVSCLNSRDGGIGMCGNFRLRLSRDMDFFLDNYGSGVSFDTKWDYEEGKNHLKSLLFISGGLQAI